MHFVLIVNYSLNEIHLMGQMWSHLTH